MVETVGNDVRLTVINQNVLGESSRVPIVALAVHRRPSETTLALATSRIQRAADDFTYERLVNAFTYFDNRTNKLVPKNVGWCSWE